MEENGKVTEKKKKLSPEEVTALLKGSAKKRRTKKSTIFFFWLLLFGLPLGLIAWFFWPRPGPPLTLLIVFDQITVPNRETPLWAGVEPFEEKDATRLGNWPVYFQVQPLMPTPGENFWEGQAETDSSGLASVWWKSPGEKKTLLVTARYAPEDKFAAAEEKGWIYCWPADTPMLLVDVERSLAKTDIEKWKDANVPEDIQENKEAIQAVLDASQKKYAVVYLACAVDSGAAYRKVRGWVQSYQTKTGKRLPPGPVLAGRTYQVENGEEKSQLLERLKGIKGMFTGNLVGVTSHQAKAEAFQKAGLKTFLVGKPDPVPEGINLLPNWEALPDHLLQNKKE